MRKENGKNKEEAGRLLELTMLFVALAGLGVILAMGVAVGVSASGPSHVADEAVSAPAPAPTPAPGTISDATPGSI